MRYHEIIKNPTLNQNFKNWFHDSKVIDAEGNPLRVYHGTAGNFDIFSKGNGSGSREGPMGFWFSDSPQVASDFAEFSSRNYDPSIVLPVYLKITNPYIVNSYQEIKDLIDEFTVFSKPGYTEPDYRGSVMYKRQIRMISDKVDYVAFHNWMTTHGYDGIILPDTLTDSPDGKTTTTQYIVFRPDQIKSAVGNKGIFSNSSNSITEKMLYEGSVSF